MRHASGCAVAELASNEYVESESGCKRTVFDHPAVIYTRVFITTHTRSRSEGRFLLLLGLKHTSKRVEKRIRCSRRGEAAETSTRLLQTYHQIFRDYSSLCLT